MMSPGATYSLVPTLYKLLLHVLWFGPVKRGYEQAKVKVACELQA